MIKSLLALSAIAFSAVALAQNAATNLVKNGDAESDITTWNKTQLQAVSENPHSGKNCFKILGNGYAHSTELIPIDTSKAYKVSCWIRSADDKKTNVYVGFVPVDADKKAITPLSVNAVPGSETVLAAACKAEDTVLKVKDASKWIIKDKINHVAFEADKSYKDLPNAKVTSSTITKVEKNGDVWDVTLDKPCGKVYPADTAVRIQRDSGWMYPVVAGSFQSQDWKDLSADIKGIAQSGVPGKQFWPGTKYVRPLVFGLNGGAIYFDDLKLEETK